jgi:hypothetical protein
MSSGGLPRRSASWPRGPGGMSGTTVPASRPPVAGSKSSLTGLIVRDFGGVLSVIALTIDAGRITAFDVVRDPDKLARISLPPEDQRER